MGHVESKKGNHYVRAAIYARVSFEQQAQAQTIASQIEALKDRITKDGLQLDQELFFIDDGHSGASLIRPALERLRDMAALGAIDKLYEILSNVVDEIFSGSIFGAASRGVVIFSSAQPPKPDWGLLNIWLWLGGV